MKLRLALAVATCMALPLAAPLAAHAQAVTGPYVSLEAGTSIQSSFNYQYWHGQGPNGHFNTRPSWAGVAGVGYGFGNGFRVQLDGNFERNTVHSLSADYYFGSYHARAFGGLDTYGPMLNALYDINVGLPVFPYVGAGVGYQWMGMDKRVYDTSYRDYDSGTRGSFAYDVIAGLSYPLPMVPGLSLTAEYRFKQQVESRNYYADCCGPTPPVNGTSENPLHIGQISSHTFLVGLRYQIFNPPPAAVAEVSAPAPAPVAAPAPAPARTFLVFFDWDKSDLTPRATQIIAEAASDSKSSSVTTLDVSGYTDTSGTPDYNQGLSQRRAEAVAGQLETDGVPTAEIEIHAYGETHLLVPTGPGVREPQNRRVEIVLQ